MKKLLALILALILSCSLAFAAVPDISGCTDQELQQLIDLARNRLYMNALKVEKDAVLIDQDGILFYLTGEYRLSVGTGYALLYLNGVLVNNNSFEAAVNVEDCAANGWDIGGSGTAGCAAGKKKKVDIFFSVDDADIFKMEDLEELTFTMKISNYDTYRTVATLAPVTFTADSFTR